MKPPLTPQQAARLLALAALRLRTAAFDPNQPRDEAGRWTDGGGGYTPEGVQVDREVFQQLKTKWARTNDEILHIMQDDPNSPVIKEKMDELKEIVKTQYSMDLDPGGLEGVGLPGGPRDVVVVGAGPSGLAAGIMGGTDGLDTLIIDAQEVPGGQARHSSRVENYPGFPVGASGERLTGTMYEQAQRVGAETQLGVRVTGLSYDPETDLKTLTLSNGQTIEARSVVLAGGVEFRRPDFPGGEDAIVGDGARLAREGAGGSVAVLGGSNGAAQAALGAARSANEVTVISRSPIEKGMSDYQVQALRSNPKIRVLEGEEITRLENKTLYTKSGGTIRADVTGVFYGGAPNTSWLPESIGRERGRIKVNDRLETSIPGVFAVGDTRVGSIGRIGTAVGDGQMSIRSVFSYFEEIRPKLTEIERRRKRSGG